MRNPPYCQSQVNVPAKHFVTRSVRIFYKVDIFMLLVVKSLEYKVIEENDKICFPFKVTLSGMEAISEDGRELAYMPVRICDDVKNLGGG